jgi:predicted TIM-barrel fold metal-dependent hydrolase
VKTTWGDLTVRDAHVHFFSHRFFAGLAAQKGSDEHKVVEALGWEAPDPDPARLAARWVAELDRHGVASAALIASLPGDESSVAAAVTAFPDRLHGYFMVDPTSDGAAARVEKALSNGLQGICFFPAMHRYAMDQKAITEILEVAAQHPGTVIFVHCGMLSVGFRKKLGLPSNFDLRFSNPLDLHTVAPRFPNLPFVVPHFGAGYFREALMLADLCPNVYFDTSSSNSWVKYLAPEPSLREVFRRTLDVAGPRRLLFGTDSSFFPRGWVHGVFDEQSKVLYELAVPDADVALILGGNLERILLR